MNEGPVLSNACNTSTTGCDGAGAHGILVSGGELGGAEIPGGGKTGALVIGGVAISIWGICIGAAPGGGGVCGAIGAKAGATEAGGACIGIGPPASPSEAGGAYIGIRAGACTGIGGIDGSGFGGRTQLGTQPERWLGRERLRQWHQPEAW